MKRKILLNKANVQLKDKKKIAESLFGILPENADLDEGKNERLNDKCNMLENSDIKYE